MSLKQKIWNIVPRSFKNKLKAISFEILSSTDESFRVNSSVASVGTPVSASASMPNMFDDGNDEPKFASPFVFNDSGILANEAMLKMVLDSIWPQEKATWKDELHYVLWENPQNRFNHQALVEFSKSWLQKRSASVDKSKEQSSLLCALILLAKHEECAWRSKMAYSSEIVNPDKIFWPNPTDKKRERSLFGELPENQAPKIIDLKTPVGSAGSCFAMEIAHRLQKDGFNYVVTERQKETLVSSCARWGIIFNTPSFRQLVERSLGNLQLPRLLWSVAREGRQQYCDPFREDIWFDSIEDYESSYFTHQIAAREALLQAEVFVLTLGMNEVWRLKSSGAVLSRAPWRLSSELVEPVVLSVEDNLKELQKMLDLWRLYNPNVKIILSVSPVPLHATFRARESHVVTANCHSKSVLRVVAEEFCRSNHNVFYFPSFETVMYCTPNAWQDDQRHVASCAVDNVMRLFHRMFVIENSLAN